MKKNRQENSRQWYAEHKDEYKRLVYNPMAELTHLLAPTAAKIDSLIVNEPRYAISRVFRDTRFSSDKLLYRDNVWITFKRPSSRWSCAPAFYVEIMQNCWRYGMGYYSAPSQTMEKMRSYISQYPEDFRKIVKPLKLLTLDTESYKRRPKGECADDLLPWFMSKGVHVARTETSLELLYNDAFVDSISEGFLQAAPLYNFMLEIDEMFFNKTDNYIPENRVKFEW